MTEFYKNKSLPDGRAIWCKECSVKNRRKLDAERKLRLRKYKREGKKLALRRVEWNTTLPWFPLLKIYLQWDFCLGKLGC